jgi:hypothetical protein
MRGPLGIGSEVAEECGLRGLVPARVVRISPLELVVFVEEVRIASQAFPRDEEAAVVLAARCT